MSRESFMELDCSRTSENVMDIIEMLNQIGWSYFDENKEIEYLPIGDKEEFAWKKDVISVQELVKLVQEKQAVGELVGVFLYFNQGKEGVTLLASSTAKMMLGFDVNRRAITKDRDAMTDISWYFEHIVKGLSEKGCIIDCVTINDYVD